MHHKHWDSQMGSREGMDGRRKTGENKHGE
jgi:hypothetical protein